MVGHKTEPAAVSVAVDRGVSEPSELILNVAISCGGSARTRVSPVLARPPVKVEIVVEFAVVMLRGLSAKVAVTTPESIPTYKKPLPAYAPALKNTALPNTRFCEFERSHT